MPELPEVETIVRGIRPHLEGRTIRRCHVRWERSLGGSGARAFGRAVRGARAARVWRRGKLVVVDLERAGRPAGALLVHLRMTGRLTVDAAGSDGGPWERVVLSLDDGRLLRFVDVRKFGRFVHRARPEEVLERLGPEPLGPELSEAWLRAALARRRRRLKPLLLDQTFVAGLGNIYVDEALHRARLHPLARSDRLRPPAVRALRGAIRSTLHAAIRREGSSFDAFYRTPEGRPGSYQHLFRVYGRAGRPCPRCRTRIRRIVVGQRGTHVCGRCQREPVRA